MSPAPPSGAVSFPPEKAGFGTLLAEHWRPVYNFALRTCLSPADAAAVTEATFRRAYAGRDHLPPPADLRLWLLKIAAFEVGERPGDTQHVSFELLDETLRSEATRTDVVRSLTDPQRNYLLWELKQGCMTAVLNCLPVSERVAFTLGVIHGLAEKDVARTLGITRGALKVRLSRARQKITSYLAARCEHVDPANPCHCPSRIGVALKAGFIASPPSADVQLRAPFKRYGGNDAPERDAIAIFESLPDPDAPPELLATLQRALLSGAWDA